MTGIAAILYGNRWSEYQARQCTQETLGEHRLLLRTTQEVSRIGGRQFDPASNSLSWTRQVCRIYDLPPDKEPSLDALLAPYPDEAQVKFRAALTQCIETSDPFDLKLPPGPDGKAQSDGETQRIHVRGEAVDDDHAAQITGTIQNVIECRQREARLRQAKTEAQQASRAKSATLANMGHEIRTPLTSILGSAKVLSEEVREGERTSHFSALIEKSGRRLLNALDRVINLSKLEAGQMGLEETTVDLTEQTEVIAEELRPEAEEEGLSMQVNTGEDPVGTRADEGGERDLTERKSYPERGL